MSQTASFSDLGIAGEILSALADMGFEEPTPIQVQTIPPMLAGRDVIGQAQTGTGKTAAYAIPALQRLDPDAAGPQALVLAPTRELALQVTEEVARIGARLGSHEVAIYGGQPIERQVRALRAGADIVVGTPGRLLDHLRRGTLRLDGLRTVVLDEGDEMLDMGFLEDVESILEAAPADRQSAIFSATLPPPIRRLAQRHLRQPVHVRIAPEHLAAPSIEQAYYETRGLDPAEALCRIIDMSGIHRGIIFCRTKRGVDALAAALQARGYPVDAIHGDMPQPQRNRALARFREGRSELLVATDVAARGLDIEGVTHVINYDIAQSPEAHIHRIGRTGRVGRAGVALTLVRPREVKQLRAIAEATGARIPRRGVPTLEDVAAAARDALRRQLAETLAAESLDGNSLAPHLEVARDLAERYSPLEVAAAAIRLALEGAGAAARGPAAEGPAGAPGGMRRLFLNVGSRQGVRPADIVRAVADAGDIAGARVRAVDVHEDFSFAEVPAESAARLLDGTRRVWISGRRVNVELARGR